MAAGPDSELHRAESGWGSLPGRLGEALPAERSVFAVRPRAEGTARLERKRQLTVFWPELDGEREMEPRALGIL